MKRSIHDLIAYATLALIGGCVVFAFLHERFGDKLVRIPIDTIFVPVDSIGGPCSPGGKTWPKCADMFTIRDSTFQVIYRE